MVGSLALLVAFGCGVSESYGAPGDLERPVSDNSEQTSEYVGWFGHKKTTMLSRVKLDVHEVQLNTKWKFNYKNIDEGFSHDYDQDTASAKFEEQNGDRLGFRIRDDRTSHTSANGCDENYDFASWHLFMDSAEDYNDPDDNNGSHSATHYMFKLDPGKPYSKTGDDPFNESLEPFYFDGSEPGEPNNEGEVCGAVHETYGFIGDKTELDQNVDDAIGFIQNVDSSFWDWSYSDFVSVDWDDKDENWSHYTLDSLPSQDTYFIGWIGKQDESWIRTCIFKCVYNVSDNLGFFVGTILDTTGWPVQGEKYYLKLDKASDETDPDGITPHKENNKIAVTLNGFDFDGNGSSEQYVCDDWCSVVITEKIPGRDMSDPSSDGSDMTHMFLTLNNGTSSQENPPKDSRIYIFLCKANLVGGEVDSINATSW